MHKFENVMCEMAVIFSRGGVTKVPFINFSVSKIFDPTKVSVRFFASHSYLTGVSCGDTCQIWTQYLIVNMYFGDAENLGK